MKRNLLLLFMLAVLTPRAMAAEFYAVYDLGTLTFYYDDERSSRSGRVYTTPDEWQEAASGTINVVFDESVAGDERGGGLPPHLHR